MLDRFISSLLIVAAIIFIPHGSVHALSSEVLGVQCLRLEKVVVSQCNAAKRTTASSHSRLKCKNRKRQFKVSCAASSVCGQPPFSCAAEICAQVMPEPVSYATLAALKADGATLLYYGACQPRIVGH